MKKFVYFFVLIKIFLFYLYILGNILKKIDLVFVF